MKNRKIKNIGNARWFSNRKFCLPPARRRRCCELLNIALSNHYKDSRLARYASSLCRPNPTRRHRRVYNFPLYRLSAEIFRAAWKMFAGSERADGQCLCRVFSTSTSADRRRNYQPYLREPIFASKSTTARGGGFAMFAPERCVAPRLGLANLVFSAWLVRVTTLPMTLHRKYICSFSTLRRYILGLTQA